MKLILTVDTFKSGEKNGIAWASASGIDAAGRRARAAFWDPREGDGRKRATAMIDQMDRAIPDFFALGCSSLVLAVVESLTFLM